MTTTIENCKITSTFLGVEDHGIFTCYVTCEGDGWSCGFGGYGLDQWDAAAKIRIGTAYGMKFIMAILSTLELEKWESLKGTHCRVEAEGWGGKIVRIGHLIKDKWFDPK